MNNEIYQIIKSSGLKVTPQRIAVYSTLRNMDFHPDADEIMNVVQKTNPGISRGSIYNILDAFVDKGIVTRVKTEKGAMLYDIVEQNHHHLFDKDSGQIRDYFDEKLTLMIRQYLEKENIPDFVIEDVQLHINGKFKSNKQ